MSSTSIQLDRSIRTLLAALRRRIRCYVWAQGLAGLVAVLGVVFWISLAVDWFFEPSIFVRKILLVAAVFTLGGIAYRILGRRESSQKSVSGPESHQFPVPRSNIRGQRTNVRGGHG